MTGAVGVTATAVVAQPLLVGTVKAPPRLGATSSAVAAEEMTDAVGTGVGAGETKMVVPDLPA